MKILLRSTLLIVVALIGSLPSAFSMLGSDAAGEENRPSEKQRSISQQQAARKESEEDDERAQNASSSSAERGTDATRDETFRKVMAESWPIKIPLKFSKTDRRSLEQKLNQMRIALEQNSLSILNDRDLQRELASWFVKGITIDPDFVAAAIAIRRDAEKKHAEVQELESIAEKTFYTLGAKQHYAAALHHSDQFIEAAAQAKDAWINTSEMYQHMLERQWGTKLKDTWAMKVDEWQRRRQGIQQDFLRDIEKIANEATANIKKFQQLGTALMQEKKYDEAASLSGAYEKIITAQRALPTLLPEDKLSVPAAIKLELGLESLKAAMIQAELKHQTMIESGGSKSAQEEQMLDNWIAIFSAFGHLKLSADETETEERNRDFQQRAAALESYAAKTLETVHDCFSIFTSGGEFADETDTNDLSAAYDRVETAAWVLNTLKARAENGEQDFWLQREKQKIAIADLEQAIKEADAIAARIGNEEVYEQDKGTAEILADLQKNKDEYERALQNEK